MVHKRGVEISQIDRNSMQIKFLVLEINTSTKFLLFGMNYITNGGVYLITDTCNFFIIPLRK